MPEAQSGKVKRAEPGITPQLSFDSTRAKSRITDHVDQQAKAAQCRNGDHGNGLSDFAQAVQHDRHRHRGQQGRQIDFRENDSEANAVDAHHIGQHKTQAFDRRGNQRAQRHTGQTERANQHQG